MKQITRLTMTLALLIMAVTGAWAQNDEPTVTWDPATKTGTFTMPASDIELQVEYYAESNLFLSKEALADKTNIAVKAGELGVQFGEDGKSANTITEGTEMTVTYNGTKKILGMNVAKAATMKTITIAADFHTGAVVATAPEITIEYNEGEKWSDVAARYDWLKMYEDFTVYYDAGGKSGDLHTANGGVKPSDLVDPNKSYYWGYE